MGVEQCSSLLQQAQRNLLHSKIFSRIMKEAMHDNELMVIQLLETEIWVLCDDSHALVVSLAPHEISKLDDEVRSIWFSILKDEVS